MDSTGHGSSETSSGENDQPEKVIDGTIGRGRSYECTFCKRGFTNAQALGGHMNIHRKDKAKAKANKTKQLIISESSLPNKTNIEDHHNYMANCKYFAPISNEPTQYYASLGAKMNYQTYFSAPNPSFPSYLVLDNSEISSPHGDDYMGENLRLRIGPPVMEDGEEEKRDGIRNWKGNEVDLELRLGHNP